ncbi:MAG: hypothetical protein SH859_07465 [Hyphomicrobium aestuarii]|nr:hypothetical protein [Hyphomicrobium aestuarii]
MEAEVIRVPLPGLALRPASGQRPAAFGTDGIAPQREVFAKVFARKDAHPAFYAALDRLEGLEVNQPFVMALAQGHTPLGRFDISGIVRAGEKAQDFLVTN